LAKAKFSQNKSPADITGAVDGLAAGDLQSRQLAEWMLRRAGGDSRAVPESRAAD
jgi:predicted FMN-binding regulatory protein PaiB